MPWATPFLGGLGIILGHTQPFAPPLSLVWGVTFRFISEGEGLGQVSRTGQEHGLSVASSTCQIALHTCRVPCAFLSSADAEIKERLCPRVTSQSWGGVHISSVWGRGGATSPTWGRRWGERPGGDGHLG